MPRTLLLIVVFALHAVVLPTPTQAEATRAWRPTAALFGQEVPGQPTVDAGTSVLLVGDTAYVGGPGGESQIAARVQAYDLYTATRVASLGNVLSSGLGHSLAAADGVLYVGGRGGDFDSGWVTAHDADSFAELWRFRLPRRFGETAHYYSVAAWGDHVLVGYRRWWFSDSGSAHLLDPETGESLRTFEPNAAWRDDSFGSAVAVNATHAYVGAPNLQSNDLGSGDFVFEYELATGELSRVFQPPSRGSWFGDALQVDETTLLVGDSGYQDVAYDPDIPTYQEGAAFVYDLATGDLLHTLRLTKRASRLRPFGVDGG